ncbi:hypothetical protein M0R45_032394 [Rubus argutus]|uniref:histone acetyltransferase n=1 Tax=Rubus argutus TaxID=59490 RepID=A0AAW1WIM4_RUBAR
MLDREVIDAVPHALRCRFAQCQTPKCREVYALLRHGTQCQVGVPGGCLLCKKMWLLLFYHALPCQEDDCSVPRCSYFSEIREETKRRVQAEKDGEIHKKAALRAAPGA